MNDDKVRTVQTVQDELKQAALSETKELERIDGRQAMRREDGSIFFLDTLSDNVYWAYMSGRERAWYQPPNEGYKG